jgi:hypothetical protein
VCLAKVVKVQSQPEIRYKNSILCFSNLELLFLNLMHYDIGNNGYVDVLQISYPHIFTNKNNLTTNAHHYDRLSTEAMRKRITEVSRPLRLGVTPDFQNCDTEYHVPGFSAKFLVVV